MDLRGTKIDLRKEDGSVDEEASRFYQGKVFEQGGAWLNRVRKVDCLNRSFLFVSDSREITQTYNIEFFRRSDKREITIPQLYQAFNVKGKINMKKSSKKIPATTTKITVNYTNGKSFTVPRVEGDVTVRENLIKFQYKHQMGSDSVSLNGVLDVTILVKNVQSVFVRGKEGCKSALVVFDKGVITNVEHRVPNGDIHAESPVRFI